MMLWTVNLWKLSRILVDMSNLRLLWLIWLEGEMAVISSQLFGVVKSGEILIILSFHLWMLKYAAVSSSGLTCI